MTSLLLPSQKSEGGEQRDFGIHKSNSSKIGLLNRKYQPINNIYPLKSPKTNQESTNSQKVKARHLGVSNL